MDFVVNVMRPNDTIEIAIAGFKFDFDPTMNNDVVKKKIPNAVEGYAKTNVHQPTKRFYFWAYHDEACGWHTENNSKKVIGFPPAFVVHVVRFVPVPHDAVHDVFVCKPGKAFHKNKRAEHKEKIE